MSTGVSTWYFAYDADGMRTGRTSSSASYTYVYNGSQLSRMRYGDIELGFTYDATGKPLSVYYNGVVYYYALNLQGDVVAILNNSGAQVVGYTYDAWGKLLTTTGSMASTLGLHNPLRYRGYVYDQETGLYYLQSRYYNPEWGRFINADSQISTKNLSGINLFSYCNNNPVMHTDSAGTEPETWQWAVSGLAVVAGIVMVATGWGGAVGGILICAGVNSIIGSYTSEAAGGSSTAGWIGGAITGAFCGAGASIAGTLLYNATQMAGLACLGNLIASCGTAFGFGFVGSYAGQHVSAALDGKDLNRDEVLSSAFATGAINLLAGVGSSIGEAAKNMPLISTTSTSKCCMVCDGRSNL